jgi:hypothetical protein
MAKMYGFNLSDKLEVFEDCAITKRQEKRIFKIIGQAQATLLKKE